MTKHGWIVAGALAAFAGVALGAFGAHALSNVATDREMGWWETATRYHLLHALALVGTGLLAGGARWRDAAGWAFAAGILVFSGSLYALGLGAPHWLGAVTPAGGLALMAGWLCLARAAWRSRPGRKG